MPFGPLMISIAATRLNQNEAKLLEEPKVGGVILFKENYQNKTQLIDLIASMRAINPQLLIAVDHEGGRVQRFDDEDFTSLPDAKSYGEMYQKSPEQARQLAFDNGLVMAQQLLQCGVNFSFAPVLDSHNDASTIIGQYRRAFDGDRTTCTELAQCFAKGMRQAGMPVTAKHFPEHGLCEKDSHLELPIDERSEQQIIAGLTPYVEFIKQDLVDIVMPAHVCYPAIDKENPAGFSQVFLQNILRDKLNFTGAIISDCLSMGAITDDPVTRVMRALNAGQDMVIFSHQSASMMLKLCSEIEDNSTKSKGRLKRLLEHSNYNHQQLAQAKISKTTDESSSVKINNTVL